MRFLQFTYEMRMSVELGIWLWSFQRSSQPDVTVKQLNSIQYNM